MKRSMWRIADLDESMQAEGNTSGPAKPSVTKPTANTVSTAALKARPTETGAKPDGKKDVRNNIVPHAGFSRDKLNKPGAPSSLRGSPVHSLGHC